MATIDITKATELFAAVGNPHRLRILVAMKDEEPKAISPKQITDRLGERMDGKAPSLGVVSYHMRTLERNRLVKQTRTRPVRGAVEHFYKMTKRGKAALSLMEE